MPLHPIAVTRRAIEEYREHLLTEFRASDERLRKALEAALAEPRFLAQDPFFQAHRPFKDGERWQDLGLDAKLADAAAQRSESERAYLHQSESIRHLLSPDACGLAVTTGTGSGKTECFLLPAIQNAIEDHARFRTPGLTTLLVYPMNALANDQEARIREYLKCSGHGEVRVERYDRSTPEEMRQEMRRSPPHLLLTNYMMLEYLLVRPADREALFRNHRCRFVVLDEVHSYRGSLGSNIALLVRRLRAHLRVAQQDSGAAGDRKRFPQLAFVATSATIKTVDEAGRTREQVQALRETAVRDFLSKLTGVEGEAFRVIGEELKDVARPAGARWSAAPVPTDPPDPRHPESIRRALVALSGCPAATPLSDAAPQAGILWTLSDLLARKPLSIYQIAAEIVRSVPERNGAEIEEVAREVEAALVAGAALPDGIAGGLRLKSHRLVRGGWRFHRCVDPTCGKLHANAEERCSCGRSAAPLYLCRTCGADALGFGGADDPAAAALVPGKPDDEHAEWVLYDSARLQVLDDDEDWVDGGATAIRKIKGREVVHGSFDPATNGFSRDAGLYAVRAALAPARTRCLVCGGSGSSRSVLTDVRLGTSAAVRVLSEGLVDALAAENASREDTDGKERLLVFADSRQDAAHQARFISFAARYDRMRRRVLRALEERGGRARIDEVVTSLLAQGVGARDNPHVRDHDDVRFLPGRARALAMAWEEAPLLDDLATTARYRATLVNLGLVGVRYDPLDAFMIAKGAPLASELGVSTAQLAFVARCLLEDMREHAALSRDMLCYHPANPNCPEAYGRPADWERRLKSPSGYPGRDGRPLGWREKSEIEEGVKLNGAWRKPGAPGGIPALQRKMTHLVLRMGGRKPQEADYVALMALLAPPSGPFVKPVPLHGARKATELLQVDADSVVLELLAPEQRFKCAVCNVRMPWVVEGSPCPVCHGEFRPWPAAEVDASRYVRRLRKEDCRPLIAEEHTAQVTGERRLDIEERFKAPASKDGLNVLACSPTLEMGIDVGGLDAVVLRNVPPRPDNYAQRGGRAGRRTRVGVVLGYARGTPHDGYFFDKPAEMIAGEVPVPAVALGNRDVVLRHLLAIALGGAEPGLAGRMAAYVNLQGEQDAEEIARLRAALEAQAPRAVELALDAWGPDVLGPAGFDSREALAEALRKRLPDVQRVFDGVSHQVAELEKTIETWRRLGRGDWQAIGAQDLKRRLLGIPPDRDRADGTADDRSAGNPMRRFAEFGLLPGYEFPSEPATLRLLGDRDEESPLTVERRFGLGQYRPEAIVHARGLRWEVVGLDLASPWNPRSDGPGWAYCVCGKCTLHYDPQEHAKCPRCLANEATKALPAHEFGGFLATRRDAPVLEEEDRIAARDMVQCHPQWNGEVVARYSLPPGWRSELRRGEEIRWLNEWVKPTASEEKRRLPVVHDGARGFYVCPTCGRLLEPQEPEAEERRPRRRPRQATRPAADPYGHAPSCSRTGQPPKPLAMFATTRGTTLRILVELPVELGKDDFEVWCLSLGYSLRTGMRQLYMLDGPEIEFEYEPSWTSEDGLRRTGALTFVDGAVGGSGFLERAASELHLVARRALEHLDHAGCDTACYRCLKSYSNQRHHRRLSWTRVHPDLEQLASAAPDPIRLQAGDTFDPKPWRDAFAAGVGSPLELAFLRLFEANDVAVDKQVALPPGSPISTADFVVRGTRTAIYVDGATFHVGDRLRRDRLIRDRLRSSGWTVIELRAEDLRNPSGLVRRVRAH